MRLKFFWSFVELKMRYFHKLEELFFSLALPCFLNLRNILFFIWEIFKQFQFESSKAFSTQKTELFCGPKMDFWKQFSFAKNFLFQEISKISVLKLQDNKAASFSHMKTHLKHFLTLTERLDFAWIFISFQSVFNWWIKLICNKYISPWCDDTITYHLHLLRYNFPRYSCTRHNTQTMHAEKKTWLQFRLSANKKLLLWMSTNTTETLENCNKLLLCFDWNKHKENCNMKMKWRWCLTLRKKKKLELKNPFGNEKSLQPWKQKWREHKRTQKWLKHKSDVIEKVLSHSLQCRMEKNYIHLNPPTLSFLLCRVLFEYFKRINFDGCKERMNVWKIQGGLKTCCARFSRWWLTLM